MVGRRGGWAGNCRGDLVEAAQNVGIRFAGRVEELMGRATTIMGALLITALISPATWADSLNEFPGETHAGALRECRARICGILAVYAAARYEGRAVDAFRAAPAARWPMYRR